MGPREMRRRRARGTWSLRTPRGTTVWSVAALVAGTAVVAPSAFASAAAPALTASISPGTARADVASNFEVTYKANAPVKNGTIRTVIPSGWTSPQTTNSGGPGYVTASNGTCASVATVPSLAILAGGATQISLTGVNCSVGARLMLDYLDADALKAGVSTFASTAQTSPSTNAASIPSPSVTVTSGPTTHFALSSSSRSTTAGASYAFTVTPEDAGGDASTYNGTVSFSSSDQGASTVLPPPTLINGTHTFKGVLTTAGSQSVTAIDTNAVPAISGTESGISVNPAATSSLAWSGITAVSPDPAGGFPVGGQLSFTLSAMDRFRNVTPGYAGRVAFGSGTDPSAVLPGAYTFVPSTDHGTHSFNFTPMKTGSDTYTATDVHTTSITGSTVVPVSIAVGPDTTADLTGTVAIAFSQSFTATGATGTVTWSATNLPAWLSLSGAGGTLTGTPMSAGTFGPFTITAIDAATPRHTGSWSYTVRVGAGSQTASFSSTPPGAPYYGGPAYTPTGTATSGLPVTFSADPSTSAVCTGIVVVRFVGVGRCLVDANQSGDADYTAAPQVQQSFGVSGATQTLSFTSDAPADAVVDGTTYVPRAITTAPGLSVALSVDPSSGAVCSEAIDGAVSFTGIGTCTIDANQAGTANWLQAAQVQQSFTVSGAPQTISFTSNAPGNAAVGGSTYAASASTTAQSLSVVLSIDSLASSVCSIDGNGNVSFIGVGVCIIDANQGGDNVTWAAATQVQQSFSVVQLETLVFTSTAPSDAVVDGSSYLPTASDTSGPPLSTAPVTLSVDGSAASVCTMDAENDVHLTGIGTCTIDANQTGAIEVQQSFTVSVPINVDYPEGEPQNPVVPPNPAAGQCPAQDPADGGCAITNVLDGVPIPQAGLTGDTTFDATPATVDPGDGIVSYAWQIYEPPTLGQDILYRAAGITGWHSSVLQIAPESLPDLSGQTDNYWTAELTVTVNGNVSSEFFRFSYDSLTTLAEVTACQANPFNAVSCAANFPQLLPQASQTISFTSAMPTDASVGGTFTPTAIATSNLPVTIGVNDSAACSMAPDGTVTFTQPGTCTIKASQAGDFYYLRKSSGENVVVGAQNISFGTPAPTNAVVNGTTYAPQATSNSTSDRTAQPVILNVDLSSSSVCSMATDGSVSFTSIGTCTIDANQEGSTNWLPATQIQQSFVVSGAPQSITFGTTAPSSAVVSGATYSPAATATSGLSVTLAVDSSSASVCSISPDDIVSFSGVGDCVIDANQPGDNTTWAPALEVQQHISVGQGSQTVRFTSIDDGTAVVNGSTYLPTAVTNAPGLSVTLSVDPSTTSVCSMSADGTVSFSSTGTCTIDASQAGTSEWLPAEVQQSFAVGQGPQIGSFTSSATTLGLDSSAEVSWSVPADGASPILYTITCNDQTAATSEPCGSSTSTATSETVAGLTPGDNYTFVVTATDANDLSSVATSSQIVAATAPGSFTASATAMGHDSSAQVSWSVPFDGANGNVSPLTYTISCEDQTTQTTGPCGTSTTATTALVVGLAPGDSYAFVVTATNTDDLSSNATTNSVVVATAPGSFTASASVDTTNTANADVSWTAADPGAGGGSVTYSLTCDGLQTTTASCGSSTSALGETVTGLNPGETYTVTVTATNSDGLTSAATTSQFMPVDPSLGAPYLPSGASVKLSRIPGAKSTPLVPGQIVMLNSLTTAFTIDASDFVDPAGGSVGAGTLTFHWVIIYSDAPTLPFTDAGITGYRTPVLQISPEALEATTTTITASIILQVQSGVNPNGLTSFDFPISVQNSLLGLLVYNNCQQTVPICTIPAALPVDEATNPT